MKEVNNHAVADNEGTTDPRATSIDLDTEKAEHTHIEYSAVSNTQNGIDAAAHMDPVEVKKIMRKIDYRLIPLMAFLYMLTFLDRVNIGNARLWNLERDLGMTGNQYNIAILVFYPPVILFEIPSNMMLTRVAPRYWISGLVFGFGISVVLAGFCKNFASLCAVRVFIGAFEAGMLPGLLFLLSSWYRRHQLLKRFAIMMLSTDIAGILSGLLGAGLGSLDGTAGYSGWSWIFFIEGGFTCVMAILAFLYLPPFPEDSTFLSPEEKSWLIHGLRQDVAGGVLDGKMDIRGTFRALRDWKVWNSAMLYLAFCVPGYAIAIFQPTILQTFGWNGIKGNAMTAPVRAVGAISSVGVGFWSDRVKRRAPFCITGFAISIVGCLMVMLVHKYQIRYFGLYVLVAGLYACQPLVLAWGTNQVVGKAKRGVVSATSVALGQFGGIITSLVFPKKDGPMYVPGMSVCIGFAVLGIMAASLFWGYGSWENKQRAAGQRDDLRALPQEEQELLGERHPDFRFTL